MPWLPLSISTSGSAGSSSLGRPQKTVIVVVGFAAIFATYQILNSFVFTRQSLPSDGLHRSNAIRRRHRATTYAADNSEENSDPQNAEWDQSESIRLLMLDSAQMNGETVAESSIFEEETGLNMSQAFERNGQNIVQLLFRVSEDSSKRNAYVHRGCACNCCGMVPIRGIRYRCANCADYDLCESCEAQGVHIKTHIFYKIRVPASAVTGPRTMQPVWYIGDPDSVTRQLPKDTLVKLSRETGFEKPELDAYWEQWTFMANTDWKDDPLDINLAMDRKTFERCLVPSGHASPCLIFERMFDFYDTNKDDLIGFAEFLHGTAYRKKKDKWKKIFEGYDIDGDGFVSRKDFLRMFRSYYVLYRTMHADILGGLAEQQITSADAHQLVSSRQPLSSAFGQDGRFPRAPDLRTGEGKIALTNEDLEIIDGKGVINENVPDHGDRQEVFDRGLLKKKRWGENRANNRGYWEMMLSPPVTEEQLTSMLRNVELASVSSSSNGHPALSATVERQIQIHDDENGGDDDEDMCSVYDYDEFWPPDFVQVTDKDAEAVDGPGTRVADVQRSSRREVVFHAIRRLGAQQEIYERWRRRNFYTDEEEGGNPPTNWKDADDIFQNGIAGGSSKSSCPIPDSKSSSKVRFAKEKDDFGSRSGPSTSSKNIYEQPGAFEIPDVEKDAGKEILYQVTQQAFNELLDSLFKKKEDIAMEAAATTSERKKSRHLYTSPEFEEWALMKTNSQGHQGKANGLKIRLMDNSSTSPAIIDTDQSSERPIEELLEAAGYQIVEDRSYEANSENDQTISLNAHPTIDSSLNELQGNSPNPSSLTQLSRTNSSRSPLSSANEVMGIIELGDERSNEETLHSASSIDKSYSETLEFSTFQDPTMPQFRPNTVTCSPVTLNGHILTHESETPKDESSQKYEEIMRQDCQENRTADPEEQRPAGFGKDKEFSELNQEINCRNMISEEILFRYWMLDKAEKEAEQRGGWGRLDLKEFEGLVKSEVDKEKSQRDPRERDKPTRFDYLGSWIEFCIP